MQLTKSEFEREFWKMVQAGNSYVRAFDIVNHWHMKTFGEFRYSDYNSFRIVRDRKR